MENAERNEKNEKERESAKDDGKWATVGVSLCVGVNASVSVRGNEYGCDMSIVWVWVWVVV